MKQQPLWPWKTTSRCPAGRSAAAADLLLRPLRQLLAPALQPALAAL